MILQKEREQIVEYGKLMVEKNLTSGTAGNISIYNRDHNLMAISPSGIDYFDTKPEDIVILDLEGNHVDGDRKPSSEYDLHRYVYLNRSDCNAVVHTHSMYATAISSMRKPLEPIHYVLANLGKRVECADYALYGTEQLAKNAIASLGTNMAVLLANHGTLTVGKDIGQAFRFSINLEWGSELYLLTTDDKTPVYLSDTEMDECTEQFKSYGQPKANKGGY